VQLIVNTCNYETLINITSKHYKVNNISPQMDILSSSNDRIILQILSTLWFELVLQERIFQFLDNVK